ncbi:ECF transporter S component [Yimella sp. cx-51]|uniref:ECF transporter S component n=1 Tax=Yimella sp. cx-51 TaxID=2770551 RepID=UPI00165E33C2|nr:ECF transporter S component [Yimella sp. cx-51]MBC9957160.1 ECF transporter S component [Yimella sp. cx-51]QTH37190.1 ECF transporter S component [Yimella sp. cx-51]
MTTFATAAPARAIPLRPRSAAAILLVSLIGVAGFAWPLFVDPDAGISSHTTDAPLLFALMLPLLLLVVLSELSEGGIDSKAIAMLGVLSAVDAMLRPLGAGTGGIEVMFFLLILAGRVFGAGFGFVLGCTSMFASAVLTAGIGPWLPFQMLGAGWVALGAGLLPRVRGRAEIVLLIGYGIIASLLYGWVLNFWFWPLGTSGEPAISVVPGGPLLTNLKHFLAFNLATSLGWDLGRAITTAVLIALTGRPILLTLRRASRKAAFGQRRAADA